MVMMTDREKALWKWISLKEKTKTNLDRILNDSSVLQEHLNQSLSDISSTEKRVCRDTHFDQLSYRTSLRQCISRSEDDTQNEKEVGVVQTRLLCTVKARNSVEVSWWRGCLDVRWLHLKESNIGIVNNGC